MWCGSLDPCGGGLGVPFEFVGQAGVSMVSLRGGLCFGPMSSGGPCPQSWVSRLCPLPLLVPVPLPVCWALLWPGSLPGGEGVAVGCVAVFSGAPSVGVSPSSRADVPSFPCAWSGGRLARAGAFLAASGPWFGSAS